MPAGPNGLPNFEMRKVKVELYTTVKGFIKSHIEMAKKLYSIRYMSVNLDLFTSKFSNDKYIALRSHFNTKGQMNSFNLAVRRYNPTVEQRETIQASNLLIEWTTAILEEYNVDADEELLTSSSDSGSDVKRALTVVQDTEREWCISHFTHICLVIAFGTDKDANKSGNLAARALFKRWRRFIEKVNKSGLLKVSLMPVFPHEEPVSPELCMCLQTCIDAETLEAFGRFLKLKNSPAHRWAAVEEVLERLLVLWNVLEAGCGRAQMQFPLKDDRTVMVEFRSVIAPVRRVQRKAQTMKSFVSVEVYIDLCILFFTTLNSLARLPIEDPRPMPAFQEGLTQPEKVQLVLLTCPNF